MTTFFYTNFSLKKTAFITSVLLGLFFLNSCSPKYYPAYSSLKGYEPVTQNEKQDSAVVALIAPYKKGVDTFMDVVIGQCDVPLTKARPECLLGNFISDVMLEAGKKMNHKTVIAVMNYGGIRLPYLNPGPITMGDIYELSPFDNKLVIVDISGKVLQKFCDHMASRKGWPISGFTYQIKDRKATNIKIDGEDLNEHLVYKMVTIDYLANGGDYCDFLRPLYKKYSNSILRDVLIENLKDRTAEGKILHPVISNRVTYDQ